MNFYLCASVVEHFLILRGSVVVCEGLKASMALWFQSTAHQANFVGLKHGLEEIHTTVVHNMLELIVTWVIVETTVVQMCFVVLNWTLLVTHHEFLERQEA